MEKKKCETGLALKKKYGPYDVACRWSSGSRINNTRENDFCWQGYREKIVSSNSCP